jgi:hypothetical protein
MDIEIQLQYLLSQRIGMQEFRDHLRSREIEYHNQPFAAQKD